MDMDFFYSESLKITHKKSNGDTLSSNCKIVHDPNLHFATLVNG